MLVIAIVVGFTAVFVGLIGLVIRLSGRRYAGDITGDQGNSVDYDDYYVGWNIFSKPAAPRSEGPRSGATEPFGPKAPTGDFAKWESEQGKNHE